VSIDRAKWNPARLAGLVLLATVTVGSAAPLFPAAALAAPRGPEKIAGTWDIAWQNSSGETRRGLIVVHQRGSQLTARIEGHGNVTATGSIAGSAFTLQGTRMAVPFTVTGRVSGRKMTGMLTALFVERRFTGTKRKGR
jgi:hypothetical protein